MTECFVDVRRRQPQDVVVDEEHPGTAGHAPGGQTKVALAVGVDVYTMLRGWMVVGDPLLGRAKQLPVEQVRGGDRHLRPGLLDDLSHPARLVAAAAEQEQRPPEIHGDPRRGLESRLRPCKRDDH